MYHVGGSQKTARLIGQTPNARVMIDCSASQIANIPSNADIVCTGPHWSSANVTAAMAQAPGAQILNIIDLNQTGTTSSGVSYFDGNIFDCELHLGYNTLPDAFNAAVGWCANHQAAHPGQLGAVYEWYGNLPALLGVAQSAGVDFYTWPAEHTGFLHSYNYGPGYPAGYSQVATQWEGTDQTATIDVSTVTATGWLTSFSVARTVKKRAVGPAAAKRAAKAHPTGGWQVLCGNGGHTIFGDEEQATTYAARADTPHEDLLRMGRLARMKSARADGCGPHTVTRVAA